MAAMVSLILTCFVLVVTDYSQHARLTFGVHGVLGTSRDPRESGPLVRDTLYGKVRGKMRTLHFLGGRKVERYLGVPYASPPVGQLRFEIPVAPRPWEGVRDAGSLPKACPQANWELDYVQDHVPSFAKTDMDEDCLYLNIYVPARKSEGEKEEEEEKEGRPVLIHVHGGSNQVGMGAMFHGDVLASLGDIIVITFNYRLGVLGFLSGHDPDIAGNFGLHDQTEAFRWVSKNIHYFGGDPAKVSIQGHSAGGGDVGLHVLSPLSKGLFRFAVMMSGSPLAYWSMMTQNPSSSSSPSYGFADSLGCEPMSSASFCLKNTTWQDISSVHFSDSRSAFQPVVDGHFVPVSPEQALTQLPLNGEVFMTGVTSDEGSLLAQRIERMKNWWRPSKERIEPFTFEENFPDLYSLMAFREPKREVPNFGSLLYHEYKTWQHPHNLTADLISVTHVYGDPTFVAPAVKVAQVISVRSDDVYFYSFNHVSRVSSDQWMGVPHGRDLFYLFGCPLSGHPLHRYSELDQNVSRVLIDLWSNFVRYGRPFQSSDPDTPLPTFEPHNQTYFILTSDGSDVKIRTAQRLRARQVAFWNSLLPKLRKKSSKSDSESTYPTLTWLFVALTSALLLVVVLLAICVLYYKNLARERCVVHATDEKNACQV